MLGALRVPLLVLTGIAFSLSAHGLDDSKYSVCVVACDDANVDYSDNMAGPGADEDSAWRLARKRYALCLYRCDPSLEQRPTLLRLFPPLGLLSQTRDKAFTTADQLKLCNQDCQLSKRACLDASFRDGEGCTRGGAACGQRCDEAFAMPESLGRQP